MNEEQRDPVSELAQGMEAAGALIESLEEEVVSLRHDLEEASVALKAAQEEVSARRRALENEEDARLAAQGEVELLRTEISNLKTSHADEQLQLRNAHINELAGLQRKLEEQRRADVEAATSEGRVEALKKEFRIEREALEERYTAELEAMKTSAEQWEEQLRESYREQEERHAAELDTMRLDLERRRSELERSLSEDFERRLADELRAAEERREAALQALGNAAAGRELELEQDYQAVVESQQAEIEGLRRELETSVSEAEDRRKKELWEVKTLAESRDREARRAHAAKLSEAEAAADRRIAALQAQREADNQALHARHAEHVARLRREYEERLATEDERRKAETWALEERLAEARIQRDSEHRAYTTRLRELEAARHAQKVAAEEDLERAARDSGAEVSALEARVAELEEALRESEELRAALQSDLERLRAEGEEPEVPAGARPPAGPDSSERLEALEAARLLSEERIADLESQLQVARSEGERSARELQETRENLWRLSDPGRRLREGIALFNASEHPRTVASISKALGLPQVHAGIDDEGKPVITFAWPDMTWRRYVSDPTEGVEEPRVYLVETGDDPSELEGPESRPNARMDAQGRLLMGVRER